MGISVGILAVAMVIFMIEAPPLLKQKKKKELWVFSILLLFGVGVSIAEGLQVNIPNPLDAITLIYKPLHDWILNILK